MFIQEPLPYSYTFLEPIISANIMELHYNKHHAGYVKNLNNALQRYSHSYSNETISRLIHDLPNLPSEIYQTVRNNLGGHINHMLFWNLMTTSKTTFSKKLSDQIIKDFGSEDEFWKIFIQSAATLFGSGWTWLLYNPHIAQLEIRQYSNQENPLFDDYIPIIGVDIWEHAYYLDYKNERNRYLEQWQTIVNKEYASQLFEQI